MKKQILIIAITIIVAATTGWSEEVFVTQQIGIMPFAEDRIASISKELPGGGDFRALSGSGSPSLDWAAYFRAMGMKWPDGSSVRMDPVSGKLVVTNTPENLNLLARILGSMGLVPSQIEIELFFVEFDRADISKLAVDDDLNVDALKAMWKKGKAELLFAPRVITQSGAEATIKGVTEMIYPTEVGMATTVSNGAPTVVDLSGFETRETGVILTVLAETAPDSSMINLTLMPQIVAPPEWRSYGETVQSGDQQIHRTIIEQPIFHTQSLSTSLGLDNGELVLVGGGMPSREPDRMVYAFIRAQLVDMKGDRIRTGQQIEE